MAKENNTLRMLIRTALARTTLVVLVGVTVSLTMASQAQADLAFHWEDRFTPAEQQKLTRWLNETHSAVEQLVGPLPFTTHMYMKRTSASEPVPWAHTERSNIQGVHFHVDPSYSLQEFRKDWTAPHELSHLILPYVGRNNAWFAEGFASYMQYQVMHQMGVLDPDAMKKRYAKNLHKAEGRYAYNHMPFAKAAARLRADRNYPTMYWGGAAFFLQADDALMARGEAGLVTLLRRYTECCRMRTHRLHDVIAALDTLSGSNDLATLLTTFRSHAGFPDFQGIDMGPSALQAVSN